MIVNKYNKGGGGSISGGSADYATLAGESNKTKLLEGGSALPQSANTGDVVAVAPTPTRGLRSANTALGIYQYDGTNWNKIEGGEGSSAYKIELTEVNPQNYTQQDIANLNAFYTAFTADTSIAYSAYIYAVDGIYRCVRYIAIPNSPIFTFEGTYNNNIVDIEIHFANNSYSYGGLQNAVPTPDFTTLKSVSQVPATLENGDVYALYTPSADAQYEVSAWTETGEYTISFDHHVQAIKVHIKQAGHFDFGFNNNADWHDGFGFDIEADGKDGYIFSIKDYDSSRWEVSEQSVKFIATEWMEKTGGKTLYLDIREDNGDYYLYIYTDDVEVIWINDVGQNTIDGEIQEGTVIPAHDAYDQVFQANVKTEPNVKIELEGNARVDGTLDNPTQIVTMSDGQMKISFHDNSNVQGVICDLESNGTYFHLYYDVSTDGWTLFGSDGENVLIKITDGESGSADFGDGNAYLSYSDGVLTAYTDNEKGWKNWDMGATHEVVVSNELAKIEDLPTKKQLVPNFDKDGWNYKVLTVDSWSDIGTSWREDTEVLRHALQNLEGFNDGEKGRVLTVKDYWGIEWQQPDMVTTEAVEELPVETKDGNMFALANASGYGIYQAQSSHTGYNFFNLEGKTIPQGVITKFRVPYTDTAESDFVHIKTDANGSGEMNLYWHPENPENKYWDIGDPNGMNQYSAEFSLTDYWGNSLVAVKVGNYIEVTFGAPIYQGDDTISTSRNTEVYTEGNVADYKSVVMSNSITNIVKLTQAEYDALVSGGTVDANTFYVIISNQS